MRSLGKLDNQYNFTGRGGPQMQMIAREKFKNWINDAAVLGLWEVIKKYGDFRKQFREARDRIRGIQKRQLVLIGYPVFNLRFQRPLQRRQPRLEIIAVRDA